METQQSRECQVEFYGDEPEVHDDRRNKRYRSNMRLWCQVKVNENAVRHGHTAWPTTDLQTRLREILAVDSSVLLAHGSTDNRGNGISFSFEIVIKAESPKNIVRSRDKFLSRIQAEKIARTAREILTDWANRTESDYEAQRLAEQANHLVKQFVSQILKKAEEEVKYEARMKDLQDEVLREAARRVEKEKQDYAGKPMKYDSGEPIDPTVVEAVFAALPGAVAETDRWNRFFGADREYVTTEQMKELRNKS